MQDIVKKSIYNTVGVLSIAQNKFRELMEELIQNGHFTEEEGKRIIDQFFFDLRTKLDTTKGGLQSKVEDFIRKWNLFDLSQARKDVDKIVQDLKNNPLLPVILNRKN